MKRLFYVFTVIMIFTACSKDDKLTGIDLSGKWQRIVTNETTPPPVWTFDNGVFKMNTTKKGDYKILDRNEIKITSTGGNSYVYKATFENEVLELKGISGNWTIHSDLPMNYKFKRYVEQ